MNPFTGVKGIPIWGTAKATAKLDVGEYLLWPECGVDGSSGSRGSDSKMRLERQGGCDHEWPGTPN